MFEQRFEFVNNFLTFKSGKSAKLQIKDRLRLNVCEFKIADDFLQFFNKCRQASDRRERRATFVTSLIVVKLPVNHCFASSVERELRISGII